MSALKRKEIIITGFGGQGIVLAGQILGKSASLIDRKETTLTQSYGPEARGGACSAQVIISSGTIHFPYVRNPDILVCLSQEGYNRYRRLLKETGMMMVDQDLITNIETGPHDFFAVPATRIAEELGNKMMANVVMLGFFTAVTAAVSLDAIRTTVAETVPANTREKNLAAFNKGYDFGLATLKGRRKKASGRKGTTV
ncbi:MAG TPA: 2-oxoacid:acceptor oxidoreductase family protein [Syntrophobacteraceae bacterium]|nr:2-oxoacid:acceptor oxidoreductase family protein [Syntrophobacteraceae bacterium]